MNILMVLSNYQPFPPDIRVEKEAQALIDAGFDLTVLCRKCGEDELDDETTEYGLRIRRVDFTKYIPQGRSTIRRGLDFVRRKTNIAPLNDSWRVPLSEIIQKLRPDAIHCHDLPIVPRVLRVAHQFGVPVIADLHENWPASKVLSSTISMAPVVPLPKQIKYWRWRSLERKVLRQCAHVIVVVQEASQRIVDRYGVGPECVTVVSNTESANTFAIHNATPAAECSDWVALYIGGIGCHRGIDTSIRAAALVGDRIPHFKLKIVGARKGVAELRSFTRSVGALDCVEIVEWVPSSSVPSYIAASKVCLVPHNECEQTNTTIPHKLFQYMIMRKPVVVSDCPPLERTVTAAEAGLVFKAGNPQSMADSLVRLYEDPGLQSRCGENGHRAATGDCSWENDARSLVSVYSEMSRAA